MSISRHAQLTTIWRGMRNAGCTVNECWEAEKDTPLLNALGFTTEQIIKQHIDNAMYKRKINKRE